MRTERVVEGYKCVVETPGPYSSWTEGLSYDDIAYTEGSSWKAPSRKTKKLASLSGATREQIQRSLEEVPRCIESGPMSHLLCHLCGGAVPPICRFPHLQFRHLQHLLGAWFASPLKTFASDPMVHAKDHIATWLGSKMCDTHRSSEAVPVSASYHIQTQELNLIKRANLKSEECGICSEVFGCC